MLGGFCSDVHGQTLTVDAPSTAFTIVSNPTSPGEAGGDQQTGSGEGDIVGNADNPSFYTGFNDWGASSLTDGELLFRLRMGADDNPAGFSRAAFVGIDGNGDGSLDAFVGVNNSGSSDTVGIWGAGTDLNISPSTTSIESPPALSYQPDSSNYNWRPVDLATDGITSLDLDGSNTDHFITFAIPFADLVSYFFTNLSLSIDENSPFTYVAASATQDNSFNQDINYVNGGIGSSSTWAELGAASDPITANGTVVPEPSWLILLGAGGILVLIRRRGSC